MPQLEPVIIELQANTDGFLQSLNASKEATSDLKTYINGLSKELEKSKNNYPNKETKVLGNSFKELSEEIKRLEATHKKLTTAFKSGNLDASKYVSEANKIASSVKTIQDAQEKAFSKKSESVFDVGGLEDVVNGGLGAAVLSFFTGATQAAGDAAETQNRYTAVFRESSSAVNTYVDDVVARLGRSREATQKSLSSFGSLAQGLGLTGGAAESFSIELNKMTNDFASFYNLSPEESQDRFIAAMSGSSEVLDQFGINIKETAVDQEILNKGINTGSEELDKMQARVSIIKETMGKNGAIGDLEKTWSSFNNTIVTIKQSFSNIIASVGAVVVSFLQPITAGVASLLRGFNNFIQQATPLGAVLRGVFGAFLAIGGVVGSVFAINGALALVGTSLGGIVLALSSVLAPVIAVGAGIASVVYIFTELYNQSELIRDAFDTVGSAITDLFSLFKTEGGASMTAVWEKVKALASALLQAFSLALRGVGQLFSKLPGVIGQVFLLVLKVIIAFSQDMLQNIGIALKNIIGNFGKLLGVVGAVGKGIAQVFLALGRDILGAIISALKAGAGAFTTFASNVFSRVASIDWGSALNSLLDSIERALKNALAGVISFARNALNAIKSALSGNDVGDGFMAGIARVQTRLTKPIEAQFDIKIDTNFDETAQAANSAMANIKSSIADIDFDTTGIGFEKTAAAMTEGAGDIKNALSDAFTFDLDYNGIADGLEGTGDTAKSVADNQKKLNKDNASSKSKGGGGGGGSSKKTTEEDKKAVEEDTKVVLEAYKKRFQEIERLKKEAQESGDITRFEALTKEFNDMEQDIITLYDDVPQDILDAVENQELFIETTKRQKDVIEKQKKEQEAFLASVKKTGNTAISAYKDYEDAVLKAKDAREKLQKAEEDFSKDTENSLKEADKSLTGNREERLLELAKKSLDIDKQIKDAEKQSAGETDTAKIEEARLKIEELQRQKSEIQGLLDRTSKDNKEVQEAFSEASLSDLERDQRAFEKQQKAFEERKNILKSTPEELKKLQEDGAISDDGKKLIDERLAKIAEIEALKNDTLKADEVVATARQNAEMAIKQVRMDAIYEAFETDMENANKLKAIYEDIANIRNKSTDISINSDLGVIPTFHTGGVVGENMTYTGGRLQGNELIAKLQYGEMVLTKREKDAYLQQKELYKKYFETSDTHKNIRTNSDFMQYVIPQYIAPIIPQQLLDRYEQLKNKKNAESKMYDNSIHNRKTQYINTMNITVEKPRNIDNESLLEWSMKMDRYRVG